MMPHKDEREEERDVTWKYLGKKMHELPEDLQRQLMEMEVTTDEERLSEILRQKGVSRETG